MPDTKQIIYAVHGLGGRAAWFDRLAQELAPAGIKLIANDLRGFGNNEPRGHVGSYHDWLNDCQREYQEIKASNPDAQVTVMGHSMGAVIVTSLPDIFPEDNIILSVPGYKGAADTFKLSFVAKVALLQLVSKETLIELPSSSKLFGGFINGKFSIEDPTASDPLRTTAVSANLLWQVRELGTLSAENIQRFRTQKVLMLQAENDAVVDNETQEEMFKLIPSPYKEFYKISDALHDWIWYDSVKDTASKISNWINT